MIFIEGDGFLLENGFGKIELEDIVRINKTRKNHGFKMTAFSPQGLYTWQEVMNFKIKSLYDGFIIKKDENKYFLPVINPNSQIDIINELSKKHNQLEFIYICEDNKNKITNLLEKLEDKFEFIYDMSSAEYIYDQKKLVELEGSEYSNLRRKLKKAFSSNEISSRKIKQEDLEIIRQITLKWSFESNNNEIGDIKPIIKAVDSYNQLGFEGIIITCDGRDAGFIFGYENTSSMFTMSMMKISLEQDPTLNTVAIYLMAKQLNRYKYINMEEDCGIEGLRTMKKLFNPYSMLGSYILKKI